MDTATGDAFALIQLRNPARGFVVLMPQPPAPVARRTVPLLPSDTGPMSIAGPTPIPAAWLATVQRRIRNSIIPHTVAYVNDGKWLRRSVAARALRFFQDTSDVLPGEPYVYSSLRGDLVAEFRAPHGSMTSIIDKNVAVTYVAIDGELRDEAVEVRDDNLAVARKELQRLTNNLRKGDHGAVEATK